ncbi:MAG: hypothetical protein NC212_06705 [Staphylococcus sp.]|nr:hypothetical protein [Staphylococcus sp.]
MSKIILYIFSLLFLASCSDSTGVGQQLREAESVMDQYPDSALRILQTINSSDLRSDRARALHALLYSQALDKNYIDVTDDSLINIAVDYFSHSSDTRHHMLSLYYQSIIAGYRQAYSKSLVSALRAYSLAGELDDKFWLGLTARNITDIYFYNYCAVEELKYARIALDNFSQTDRRNFMHYAICDLARAYHTNEDYPEAIRIATELLDTAAVYNDPILAVRAQRLIGLASLGAGNISDARGAYDALRANPTATLTDSVYYAVLSLKMGERWPAISDIKRWMASPAISSVASGVRAWMKYNYYQALDSTSKALSMKREELHVNDSIFKQSRRQNLAGTVMEFHHYQSELDHANLRLSRIRSLLICLTAMVVIAIVLLLARRRVRRQQALIEQYHAMASDLRLLLSEATAVKQSVPITADPMPLQPVAPSMCSLENFIADFDSLCRDFRRDDSPESRRHTAEGVGRMIDSFSADNHKFQELESYADYRFDCIMSKLRLDCPGLKEIDYQVFLLSRLGFSIATMALLLRGDDNKTFIYNRRKRLREKFRAIDGPMRDVYLEVMA